MIRKYPKPENFEPEVYFSSEHPFAGHFRCHAWSRQNNRQCLNAPVKGYSVCRMHGAKSGRKRKDGLKLNFGRFATISDKGEFIERYKPSNRQKYVYLAIRPNDGLYKIGISDQPEPLRRRQLESATSVAHEMLWQVEVPFPFVIERILKSIFSEFVTSELDKRGRERFDFNNYDGDIEKEFPNVVSTITCELLEYISRAGKQ